MWNNSRKDTVYLIPSFMFCQPVIAIAFYYFIVGIACILPGGMLCCMLN